MTLDVFCHVCILLDMCLTVLRSLLFWVSFCAVDPLRSLLLFSRSMWGTTVCFTEPLHNTTRAAADLDCFTVCFWTGMNLSPRLFPVTCVVVRLHSTLPLISLTHTFLCLYTYILYVNFVITCFYCWKFLPITETSIPSSVSGCSSFWPEVRPFCPFLS